MPGGVDIAGTCMGFDYMADAFSGGDSLTKPAENELFESFL